MLTSSKACWFVTTWACGLILSYTKSELQFFCVDHITILIHSRAPSYLSYGGRDERKILPQAKSPALADYGFDDEDAFDNDDALDRAFDGVVRLPNGQGQCLRCGKICTTYGNANKHYKFMHAPRKSIKCPICGQVSVNDAYFETACTLGAKLSILLSAAFNLCCRISRSDRFSTSAASS